MDKLELEKDIIPLRYCVITLIVGVILVTNFFMAARFHFKALDINISIAKARAGNVVNSDIESSEKLAEIYETTGKLLVRVGLGITLLTIGGFFIFSGWNSKTINQESELSLIQPILIKFLEVSKFLFSLKTQKDTFEPIIADWQEEYFEALFKKEIWKARWINIRYTYAFIVAMWQKSPIGDLIEFVRKIAS